MTLIRLVVFVAAVFSLNFAVLSLLSLGGPVSKSDSLVVGVLIGGVCSFFGLDWVVNDRLSN